MDLSYFANGGPCANLLTARIEERLLHRADCVLVSSATAGLMAALRAVCGEPRGRRKLVACPSYTFPATAGAIAGRASSRSSSTSSPTATASTPSRSTRVAHAAEPSGLRYQRNAAGSAWQYFQAVAPDPETRERILAAAAAAQVDARCPLPTRCPMPI